MGGKGDVTKNKIMKAAVKLIFQKGIESTSISDIVKEAGVAKGSIFFHFPDKQTLVSETLNQYENNFFIFLEQSLTGNTPGERLINFFENVSKAHKERNYAGGCIFGNTALEMADKNEIFTGIVSNVFRKWVRNLKEVIQEAVKTGEIRKDIQPDVLAPTIVAALEGGIMLARLEKSGEPLEKTICAFVKMLDIKTQSRKEGICLTY
ncbi:MAG: TetR/AcrR family transcriptional regulator [Flexistipes sinusarabici]|uniref:TetR/AcrR family transcriptional regulator n=1 Tax=Flexistipes sinusarabici TaxID=2352 RepID=A0A5D0MLT0_FLESI|nr:TetR/AcrR family transcriptional regulator [Flexistipes sinusarabici]TYB33352.1 MAG: TetR/AcrR family transcriptional regulator [Flexistipes sinusarabici]